MRSATAPATIVAAVPQNITWKTKKPISSGARSRSRKQPRLGADGQARGGGPEGERESPPHREGEDGEDEVEEVLLRDVDRVLGAHRAGFEQHEADLHQEDQRRRGHQPGRVEAGGDLGVGCGRGA